MDDRQRKEAGRAGEAAGARRICKQAGLQLVLRNFRCKRGEIDLVMLDGATLVLVEVRYRSSEQLRRRGRVGHMAQAAPARACGAVPAAACIRSCAATRRASTSSRSRRRRSGPHRLDQRARSQL